MAEHIEGPLYYERMGRAGPPVVFVHPNPMDQSCWLYQMAHLSTWYRCIAVDIPGYGKSPKGTKDMTRFDMAQALWEAVDDAIPDGEPAILAGCSVGSSLVPHMYHLRPKQTAAMVLSGTGYTPPTEINESGPRHIKGYTQNGVDYRWHFTFQDFSAAFRTTPMAHWFADLFMERNAWADVPSIITQLGAPRPESATFYSDIGCPTIILTGSEDGAHPRSFALKEQIPGCELKVLPGAGHACQMEQPWLFDKFMLDFLKRKGLFNGIEKPMATATA